MGGIILWIVKYRSFLIWFLAVSCVFSSGWYARSVLCSLSEMERERQQQERVNKMLNDANEASSATEKDKAKREPIRRQITRRIANAEDSSFGCHVNADGMQLLQIAPSLSHATR